jgi:hypothetical protein
MRYSQRHVAEQASSLREDIHVQLRAWTSAQWDEASGRWIVAHGQDGDDARAARTLS